MQGRLAPNYGDGAGRWLSTASPSQSSSLRTDQHQMKADAARGKARGDTRRLTPAAHKAQARRLGRGDVTPVLSHCRSAASISPHSRRPVLETLPGIGLHFPAERIRAARGAFNSIAGSRANASRQSLRDKPPYQVAIAEIHHLTNRLSSSAVLVGIDPNENGLTHAKRSFAPGAKAND